MVSSGQGARQSDPIYHRHGLRTPGRIDPDSVERRKRAGHALQALAQHLAPLTEGRSGESLQHLQPDALRLLGRLEMHYRRHDLWRGREGGAVDRHRDLRDRTPLREDGETIPALSCSRRAFSDLTRLAIGSRTVKAA